MRRIHVKRHMYIFWPFLYLSAWNPTGWLDPKLDLHLTHLATNSALPGGRRKDKRGVDLISDALPFGRLWYGQRNAVAKRNVDGKWKFGLDLVI